MSKESPISRIFRTRLHNLTLLSKFNLSNGASIWRSQAHDAFSKPRRWDHKFKQSPTSNSYHLRYESSLVP